MAENVKTNILKGKKLNMSQVFGADGVVIPVTVLELATSVSDDIVNKQAVLVGKSKGKGFAGVMKRWNFSGQRKTHGQSDSARKAGSIGGQTPGRVFKGKKMAGRMGNKKITLKRIKILTLDGASNRIAVAGPVPGARNSKVILKLED